MDAVEALAEVLPARRGPAAGEVALEVSGVAVSFGGVAALNGVGARVAANEVAAVVGPNGAGKTTLLNAVSGLLDVRVRGEIVLCGQRVNGMSASRIARLGLGRSFQHPPLLEEETIVENILLGANLHLPFGLPGQMFAPWRSRRLERAERERALALLDFVGLSKIAGERASGLPYGSRKLVDIVRAIFMSPALLALDEPTSGLDSREQQTVVELVQKLAAMRRMTVLLVEHHMDIVRACASQVLGMQAGRVIASGTPEEVFGSQAYREAVVGRGRGPAGGAAAADLGPAGKGR
jgi:ABC-type branched-subunit amino acid transport system ATPase component